MSPQEKTMGEKAMSGILPAFLRSPVRKTLKDPLVTSIYTRVEAVLQFEVHADKAATKERYVEDVIQYITRGGKQATLREALHPSAIFLPRVFQKRHS
jgi:hypothetical protein